MGVPLIKCVELIVKEWCHRRDTLVGDLEILAAYDLNGDHALSSYTMLASRSEVLTRGFVHVSLVLIVAHSLSDGSSQAHLDPQRAQRRAAWF